jgi:methyltransferase OMS1
MSWISFKLVGVLYSATALPVLYLRYQSREKRKENEAFIASHGLVAPESERRRAITHMLSGDAVRTDSNEYFEGSKNCNSQRKKAIMMARGDVLEVGIGTGEKTLELYERNKNVKKLTGIDDHDLSLEVCATEVTKRKNRTVPVTLVNGRAESLPFEDKSFDTVVSQFSLCSIEDPVAAIREMVRVSRGRVILVEHGLSYWSVVRWLGYWTSLFPDPQHPWSYGCYQDRDVLKIVKDSGVKVKQIKTSSLGHVYLIILAPQSDTDKEIRNHEPNVVFRSEPIGPS